MEHSVIKLGRKKITKSLEIHPKLNICNLFNNYEGSNNSNINRDKIGSQRKIKMKYRNP